MAGKSGFRFGNPDRRDQRPGDEEPGDDQQRHLARRGDREQHGRDATTAPERSSGERSAAGVGCAAVTPEERLARYARLAVEVGINLQPGQLRARRRASRSSAARPRDRRGRLRARREVRRGALRRSARPAVADHPRAGGHARLVAAVDARRSSRSSRRTNGALIAITGDPEPELFADLDPARIAKARPRLVAEKMLQATGDGEIAWTIVGYPNAGWAEAVFGEPDVERLWEAVAIATRLDEDDPVAAWRAHIAKLGERSRLLNERRFDGVRFRGPGTDLFVGLIPRVALDVGLGADDDRHRDGREHADRGGLHDAAPPPHRGRRPLDDAARRERADRARPLGALLGRPRHRGDGDERRRRRPRGDEHRRGRLVPRRGVDRRRRLGASARPASSSSTRSSTRTRPATSPTASGSRS